MATKMSNVDFQLGDKIKFKGSCNSARDGEEYIVIQDPLKSCTSLGVGSDKHDLCHCNEKWELISNKITIMNQVKSMFKRLVDADTQTLFKAGYINGDLALTTKGQEVLLAILFSANKAALVNEAQAELDEEVAAKK